MVVFHSPTVVFLVSCTALVVHAQYFRPYPAMAMDQGFSPYHPARINHETLPISQAEFAQLVAESMATSHGPHHHHPPNTDANYEGPDHMARDQAMLRGGGGGHGGHHHHHHGHDDHQSSSQYQPEDNYRSHHDHSEADHDDGGYHRAPVYENSYNNAAEEEGDDDQNSYGGRPGVSDGSGSDGPSYDNYDHPHHMHHEQGSSHHGGHPQLEEGEESRLRPTEVPHYMPVANVLPVAFV